MHHRSETLFSSLAVRLLGAALAVAACVFLILTSARTGFARLLEKYAMLTYSLPAANQATRLARSDADAHRVRAAVLSHLKLIEEAENELEQATSLRPKDDYLWLELGNARDEIGDTQGALAAFNEAVRFAPYYAHTRWQRGNLLLRMGHYEQAIADLRQASLSNSNFLPNFMDLAWGLSRGDAKATEQLLQINDDRTRLTYARFLARHGKAQEAVEQFRLAQASALEETRMDFLRQLIDAKAFREAFNLWKGPVGGSNKTMSVVYDGGFEGQLSLDEEMFGWRLLREQEGVTISLDATQQHSGTKSLRIQFNGNSNPNVPLLSQLILVKPQQRYRVNFAASTKDIVTGGLPFISIKDAGAGQLLGRSSSFPQATHPWQVLSFDFTTSPTTDALILSLQRNNCTSAPCPIFGFVWLDSFSIQELSDATHPLPK